MKELPFKIGTGYDSHRFAPGRKLVLCGTVFDHPQGLLGHSDADAPVHALIDAILGALAMGDIGRLFPDNDPAYKDADSMALLKKVMERIGNWQIGNADLTIITESPKLAPHIDSMRKNLASALNTELNNISVKAKTAEKLGPVGAGEALEAYAVVLMVRKEAVL